MSCRRGDCQRPLIPRTWSIGSLHVRSVALSCCMLNRHHTAMCLYMCVCVCNRVVFNYSDRVCVSHAGGQSQEAEIHSLCNEPLDTMDLHSTIALLCATYDKQAQSSLVPLITPRRVSCALVVTGACL